MEDYDNNVNNADQVYIDKINEMKKEQKLFDDLIKYNQHIEKLHLAAGNVDNIIVDNDNEAVGLSEGLDKLPVESLKLSEKSTNIALNVGPILRLVVKNTYDRTLPQWFTLPYNAINPTISLGGGGGGGGGGIDKIWSNSAGGGSGGETIWNFPLNSGDTIYSVIGTTGTGGYGVIGPLVGQNGSNGGTTIVEGSANFPVGGLRARGGNGGEGARSNRIANGGQWVHSGNSYAVAGQSGGNGGYVGNPRQNPKDGWACYHINGGKAGYTTSNGAITYGGGGGGASMIGTGGNGGDGIRGYSNGLQGNNGGGGGGAGSGSYIYMGGSVADWSNYVADGGNGGIGWVRVQYYVYA